MFELILLAIIGLCLVSLGFRVKKMEEMGSDLQDSCYLTLIPKSEDMSFDLDTLRDFFRPHGIIVISSHRDGVIVFAVNEKMRRWLRDPQNLESLGMRLADPAATAFNSRIPQLCLTTR